MKKIINKGGKIMDFMEFSAKTVNDCITNACRDLGVTSDKLEYEVLSEGTTFTREQILKQVEFQEKYFKIEIEI